MNSGCANPIFDTFLRPYFHYFLKGKFSRITWESSKVTPSFLPQILRVFKTHPHSRSQTLRIFEGYPCQFSNPDAALIIENYQNSRTRMRNFEDSKEILKNSQNSRWEWEQRLSLRMRMKAKSFLRIFRGWFLKILKFWSKNPRFSRVLTALL